MDDERLARSQLRALLAYHSDVDVVGEADHVQSALAAVDTLRPNLVFLDIQMPGLSGFDFLERAEGDFRTIFVTAYDAFALHAFDVNALDYLLKPVEPDRLARALERLFSADNAPDGEPTAAKLKLSDSDHLFVTSATKARFIPIRTIQAIRSAGAYSEIYTANGGMWMMLRGLKEWESRLPSNFVRIHRSTIVNLEFVELVEAQDNYCYSVFLRGQPKPFTMSRRAALLLKDRLA